MPVVINGSTGISGTDGSASTPAVQGTDTNTGLFFPAADTIAFAEGGTEVMRIDSAGNVGVATTTPQGRLDVRAVAGGIGAVVAGADTGGNAQINVNSNYSSTRPVYGFWFNGTTGIGNPAVNVTSFITASTETMRVDSAGRVGIGTSSPTERLSVDGNATFTGTAVMASSFLRNRIINGGMQVAQRGTSGTSGYLLDRWITFNTTAQSQSSDAPTGFINSLEFTSSSATFPFASQRIERANSYDLAGRVVTFSFWAKNVSGSSNLYAEIYRADAADNFSSVTFEGQVILTASPSASWTFYSGSITLSANATGGMELRIIRNNASAASTRITGVQLEVGSVATPFERRQFGTEFMLCQRYYQFLTQQLVYEGTINGTATAINNIALPVPMRTSPTVGLNGLGGSNANNLTVNLNTATTLRVQCTAIVTGTAFFVYDATLSAEL